MAAISWGNVVNKAKTSTAAKKGPVRKPTPVKKPTPPKKPVVKTMTPGDYLSGSKIVGQKYTAWDTYGEGKPDFGKLQGPGDPYRKVERVVGKPGLNNTRKISNKTATGNTGDPRMDAIRRRLRGL